MAQQNFYPNSVLLDTSRETLYNTAMSHHSHCNWRPTLWLYYTDSITVPRHAQHCDGQWLISDSYCASSNLLYHVVRMRVLTSNYIANDTWPDAHYRIAISTSPDAHCVIALWRRIGFWHAYVLGGPLQRWNSAYRVKTRDVIASATHMCIVYNVKLVEASRNFNLGMRNDNRCVGAEGGTWKG